MILQGDILSACFVGCVHALAQVEIDWGVFWMSKGGFVPVMYLGTTLSRGVVQGSASAWL